MHATKLTQNLYFGILGSARFGAHLSLTATLGILLMVLMVVLPMIAGQHITPDAVIARLNYGVIFRPQQPVRIVTEEWTHVFITPLPEQHDETDEATSQMPFNCSEIRELSTLSCKHFTPLFNTLLTLHKTSISRVISVIRHIYEILPENQLGWRTRSLFDLGGKILHSIFGVATDKQVNAIRTAAQKTITENVNAFHRWQEHAETMSSFMSVANKRLNNLATVVRDHQKVLQSVYQSMS